MSTFYERACKLGAWQTGGALDLDELRSAMVLHSCGLVDVSYVADRCVGHHPLTAPQLAELTTLLGKLPRNLLAACNAVDQVQLAHKAYSVFSAARDGNPGFTTEALVKKAMGV